MRDSYRGHGSRYPATPTPDTWLLAPVHEFCPDLPQGTWRKLSHFSLDLTESVIVPRVSRRLDLRRMQQNREDSLPNPAMEAVGYQWHSTCFELNGVLFDKKNHEMSKMPYRDANRSSHLPWV